MAALEADGVVTVHELLDSSQNLVIEAVAHGDRHTSKVVGRRICEVPLPTGTTIGALVRGDQVLIAYDDLIIRAEDHVILFLVDKRRIPEVERLFQVSVTFV